MTPGMRWKLAAGGAAVVAAAVGGVAIAAATHHDVAAGQGADRGGMGFFRGGGGYGPPDGFRGGPFGGLDAAATYLGLTQQQLFQQLRSGKTLAQVAGATSGRSVAGLVSALVAAQKQQLESAVASGRITRAQADQLEAQLQQRVTAMVDGTLDRGPRGFAGPRGFDPDGDHGHGVAARATFLYRV